MRGLTLGLGLRSLCRRISAAVAATHRLLTEGNDTLTTEAGDPLRQE